MQFELGTLASIGLIQVAVFLAVSVFAWWLWGSLGRTGRRYGERFNQTVEIQLARSHLFIDPRRLLTLNVVIVVAVGGAAYVLSGSGLIALVAAGLAGLSPRILLAHVRRTRRERFRQQLPDLMLLTAGGLRAGASLWQALAQVTAETAPPARQEIEMMLREQRLGVSLNQALAGLERRMGVEETRLLSAALRIAHETGGNLAETLESLAESTRRKQALEAKVDALTSQGKLQGWVMGCLPLLLGLVLFKMEPVAMSALFTTWYGLSACAAIVVLQSLGFLFVRRIVSVDV
ncbi:MAG: type II secretion system F family protein [Burkholderiaceae bacterium]